MTSMHRTPAPRIVGVSTHCVEHSQHGVLARTGAQHAHGQRLRFQQLLAHSLNHVFVGHGRLPINVSGQCAAGNGRGKPAAATYVFTEVSA